MMDTIQLDNVIIPYKIVKKKNKNTYFYFKKDGYIQVNASRYQSKKDILNYIKSNKHIFLLKFKKICVSTTDESQYYRYGNSYKRVEWSKDFIYLDHKNSIVYEPTCSIDQLANMYKINEKEEMFALLHGLQKKYSNNGLVDISNIKLKTRYTTTRHGSCNHRKRTININLHLLKMEPIYTEYVFLHEIAHLDVPNHSSAFYQLLEKLCPNYKTIRHNLKQKRLG